MNHLIVFMLVISMYFGSSEAIKCTKTILGFENKLGPGRILTVDNSGSESIVKFNQKPHVFTVTRGIIPINFYLYQGPYEFHLVVPLEANVPSCDVLRLWTAKNDGVYNGATFVGKWVKY
ncbi:hypothetical protein ISN44_As06g022840 [Arabidopsis suecica]|uniref:S-protein homolog n=1 Tax=Arabidopsis suecica TaxID=45249 RepID=A0A8T2CCE8_ARASU|nr:hypothetical protein ISN44_As06g022830 [Arabidopsis suecica]KAG7597978.1 hypothetical protein ISN44_As06g022840 [Arabidopsis suecica]